MYSYPFSMLLAVTTASPIIEYVSGKHPLPAPGMVKARTDCGQVGSYYFPTAQDWQKANTDQWLKDWMSSNASDIKNDSGGFASAMGVYTMGDPNFNCQINGASGNCNVDVCNGPINGLGNSTQPAYYVLQSVSNIHAYFDAMTASISMSGLLGALQSATWTTTFYKQGDGHDADDAEDRGITALKEILSALTMVVGIAAAFVAPEIIPAEILSAAAVANLGIATGVGTAIFGGAISATNINLKAASGGTNNFAHAADVANAIGNVVQGSWTDFVTNNNNLMMGQNDTNGNDIRTYVQGGAFLNSSTNEVAAVEGMNAMLQGMAINQLWRQNKIFILGGGKCGDGQGIGSGPQNYSWCDKDTNTAWYIYFWQANDVISTTAHQWGWAAMPPGADQLGSGQYQNVTIQNVIQSSVNSYKVAGYNYTSDVAMKSAQNAIADPTIQSPMSAGAAWEGTFTIPVCNLSSVIGVNNFPNKGDIMMDYGHDSRMQWCGPICNNDLEQTKQFINATLMENFKSPTVYCKTNPGYSTLS